MRQARLLQARGASGGRSSASGGCAAIGSGRSLPVTVLLPFRDSVRYIRESLESIREQTFRDFEVLLIDDGSCDGSSEIAREYCGSDRRFRVVDSRGSGLVEALNTGLSTAKGEWIARHDADDICHPRRLELQYDAAVLAGSGSRRTVLTSRVHSFREDGVRRGYRIYEAWLNSLISHEEIERNIFVESPVPHPTAFFHRSSLLESDGWYRQGDFPEDYELWLRLWTLGFRFERVPEVLVEWRDHPDRLSRRDSRYSLTSFYRLKARYLHNVRSLADRRVVIWGSGQAGRRLSGFLLREGFTIEGFVTIVPERVGRELRGAPIVAPEELSRLASVPILVASRAWGARDSIREFLESTGRRNWRDFVLCT